MRAIWDKVQEPFLVIFLIAGFIAMSAGIMQFVWQFTSLGPGGLYAHSAGGTHKHGSHPEP